MKYLLPGWPSLRKAHLWPVFALFLVFILFPGASTAIAKDAGSDDPVFWLKRMQQGAIENNYRGTFVFTRGSMSSTVQVVHRFKNGVEQERLTQLDGAMGEVIRNGRNVMCVLPDNRVVKVEQDPISNPIVQAFSGFMPEHGFYRLAFNGHERVINRPAVKLSVDAKDKYRYSYRLWLDKSSGLLLKSSLLDQDKSELERFHYSALEFSDGITDKELNPITEGVVIDHQVIPPARKDAAWPGAMSWKLGWVPPGYKALGEKTKPGTNVMVYSDGLANFSVFVEPAASDSMPEGASRVGATVAYFYKVMQGDHHYGVTVMGEIPAMTAMMIAESVVPDMSAVSP